MEVPKLIVENKEGLSGKAALEMSKQFAKFKMSTLQKYLINVFYGNQRN